MNLLLEIVGTALMLSMLAVGGAIAVIPELFRIAVENRGWLTAAEFNELFAIGQAAPGPNVLVVMLVAWQAHGVLSAILAAVAFLVPSSVIAVLAFRRLRSAFAPDRAARIRRALAPISIALVAASGVLIGRNLEGGLAAYAIAAGACAWATAWNVHPIIPIAAGAAAGAALL